MADERNEQSVLISLDELTAEVEEKKVGAAAGGESGLIDIGALESAGLLDDVAAEASSTPDQAVAPSSAGAVKGRRGGGGKAVAMVFGALVLVGGSVYATLEYARSQKESAASATNTTPDPKTVAPENESPKNTPAAVVKNADAGTAATAAKKADAGTTAAAKKADAGTTVASKKPGKKKNRNRGKRKKDKTKKPALEADKPEVAVAQPRPKKDKKKPDNQPDEADNLLAALSGNGPARSGDDPAGSVSGDPLLPKSLSRGQILGVVRKNAAQVRKCKSAGGDGGLVKVKLSIKGSGTVSSAKVTSAQKGSALAACVERKVRVFRFPQFSGKVMSITLPFSI